MKKCQKSGLNPTKLEILNAVQKVMQCFKKGKVSVPHPHLLLIIIRIFQRLDRKDCEKKSTAKIITTPSNQHQPGYFDKIEDFANQRDTDSAIIVELSNVGDRFEAFRKYPTLVLQAVDLNNKDFCFALGQVLLKEKAIIYVETMFLTEKAVIRLKGLLQDFQTLFDDRLWIILFSENEASDKFVDLVELEFEVNNKKRKTQSSQEVGREEKASKSRKIDLKKNENVKSMEKSENVKSFESAAQEKDEEILVLVDEISKLRTLLEREKCKHNEEALIHSQESDKIKLKLQGLEEHNRLLQDNIENLKSDIEDSQQNMLTVLKETGTNKNTIQEQEQIIIDLRTGHKKRIMELENMNEVLSDKVNKMAGEEETTLIKHQDIVQNFEEKLVLSERNIRELQATKEELSEKLKTLKNVLSGSAAPSNIIVQSEKSSQTKLVVVSVSPLTNVVQKIHDNKAKLVNAGSTEILHRSIKHLKCIVKFRKLGSGKITCDILVEKGEGLVNYKDLLNWTATADTELVAKTNAFDLFLSTICKFEKGD